MVRWQANHFMNYLIAEVYVNQETKEKIGTISVYVNEVFSLKVKTDLWVGSRVIESL